MGLLSKLGTMVLVTASGVGVFTGASIFYEKQKFYDQFLIPTMHKLDPEWAHRLSVLWLKYGLVPSSNFKDSPILAQRIKHLEFRNPLGIAAGFDKHAEAVESLEKIGFGFVEVGSITPLPQSGNEKPRVFRLPEDRAIVNRYGFNSDGHDVVYERLKKMREQNRIRCVLGVNLGKNKITDNPISDYVAGVEKFGDVADYFVINVSSPNTTGLRELQSKDNLKPLLIAVTNARDKLNVNPKPLAFVKLAPDLTPRDKKDVANVVSDSKCRVDGLIISNTTIDRNPHLKSEKAFETGGLSGLPLKDASTNLIREMYKMTKGQIPIIGAGGIFSGEDAYEKIQAGASLVQIYTSFVYGGPPVVSNIKKELEALVTNDGYGNITDCIGKQRRKA